MAEIYKEYAAALFGLALEKSCLDSVCKDMKILQDVFSRESDYVEFLSSPAIPMSERLNSIQNAFSSLHEYSLSFLQLLCENGYVAELLSCVEEFFLLEKLHSRKASVKVFSAHPMTERQKEELLRTLEHKYQKTIEASYEIEPSLLGGFKVVADEIVIDASLKSQLEKVRGVMNQ